MLTLLARAAVYRPEAHQETAPVLPKDIQKEAIQVNHAHCRRYHDLVKWPLYKDNIMHPNYVQTLSLPMQLRMMTRAPFPFRALGLVHIANRMNVIELPACNDNLELNTYFGRLYTHKRGFVFEIHTDASKHGTVALKATSFYLARSKKAAKFTELPVFTDDSLLDDCSLGIVTPDILKSASEKSVLAFSENSGRQYAKVSGDYNPIHLWSVTSRLFGFKCAIAHGMYSHALSLSSLQETDAVDVTKSMSIRVVFKQPIMLPGSTHCVVKPCSENSMDFCLYTGHSDKAKIRPHLVGCVSPFNL